MEEKINSLIEKYTEDLNLLRKTKYYHIEDEISNNTKEYMLEDIIYDLNEILKDK